MYTYIEIPCQNTTCFVWLYIDHVFPSNLSYYQLAIFVWLKKFRIICVISCEVALKWAIFWATILTLGLWKKISVQENWIVSLDLIAKLNIGLARDGQTNLCVITEIILMHSIFCTITLWFKSNKHASLLMSLRSVSYSNFIRNVSM